MLEMPQLIQTWKEVSYIIYETNLGDVGLTISREDMDVDGRSGRNRRRVYQAEGVEIVQYVCRALLGAHSKEDGVHNICQVSFNARMCSKYLYQILNRMHVTVPLMMATFP